MRYHVYYVVNCSPKIKSFKTELAMKRFANKVGYSTETDSYVEFTFKGEFLYKEDYYKTGTGSK
jgi:hypothetical protein